MIEIKDLKKSFDKTEVLKGIDINFNKGTIHGIIGPNGAGKTTFFRCISGLENFDGKISYLPTQSFKKIGYLPTELYILPKITGKEYLTLFLNARKVEIKDIDANNIFDLPLNRFVETYSTGMKKKLAFTAILLQKNDVFILDEPFNGVDIQSNILITEIILKLKDKGKTILIASHIFSTLIEICDKMYLLNQGVFENEAKKDQFHLIEKKFKKNIINDTLQNFAF